MTGDREVVAGAACLFRALSERRRLTLIQLLATHGELFTKQIVLLAGTEQPSVSRHLAYLKRAGLVTDRRSGRWVYWSARPLPPEMMGLLHQLLDIGCPTPAVVDRPVGKSRNDAGSPDRPGPDGNCSPGAVASTRNA